LEPLTKLTVDKNPFKQFAEWYDVILKSGLKEPTAMTLATASRQGIPSARTVLLKGYDESGFIFFTNYESSKGKNLIENPAAELLFYWQEPVRQVRVSGKVEKTSREESENYFRTRPYESQVGAWASNQSEIIPDREFLEKKFAEFKEKFGRDVPLPPFWGGFRLIPEQFEFWQGRKNRLHDRICYRKKNGEWEIVRLAP
jgi:pyridoxamine 5'-phosphate oxidase